MVCPCRASAMKIIVKELEELGKQSKYIMEILGVLVGQLVECMSPSIAQRWKDHRAIYGNVDNLKRKLAELNFRKADIDSKLAKELIEGKTELGKEVKSWLECAQRINEEVNGIEEEVRRVKFFSRATLGKKVRQKIVEVEVLHGKGTFPQGLVVSLPNRGDLVPTTAPIAGEKYKQKMEEIWACLLDDEVTKVGVHGMGGIGKTTALEHLHNRLLQDQKDKFDNVIWVTVPKDSNVENLQDKIASKLGLNISDDNDQITRAAKLLAEFGRKKRYVLILDDLWKAYSLKDIGIPDPTPQNGCKLVLTTRSSEVCRCMSCKPIPMELLSQEEALNLFLDIVGRDILSIPNLKVTVEKVAQECAGLPLAIVTIAGSLKGVIDQNEWEIALNDLMEATMGSKSDEIFKRLKFSYDRLSDKKLQDCLLYCALYPEDYPIERYILIEHLVVEGIVEERTTRQLEIQKGQVMLNKLVDVCLLNDTLDLGGDKCVKMHDLVRDMALQIRSDQAPLFLVKAGMRLKEVPNEENWKNDLVRASLIENDIRVISSHTEAPNCPRLLTLLLSSNFYLRCISDEFFLHMRGLSVLDLSYNDSLENIPESVCDLVTLTALFIRGCAKLRVMPSLAKLRELRKLDFKGSGFNEVPKGMEKLIKLRYIDFSDTGIEIIPAGILCKLTNLQYLSLNHALFFHESKAPKVTGEELKCLSKLESFEGQLYDINSWNAYVTSLEHSRLTSYVLQLGDGGKYVFESRFNKSVVLLNGDSCKSIASGGECLLLLPKDIEYQFNKSVVLLNGDSCKSIASGRECLLLLPKDVEELLVFDWATNVNNLCELASFDNVTNLRLCGIGGFNNKMEHVFPYSDSISTLLKGLERLGLFGLSNLRGLIRNESGTSFMLPPDTFSSLTLVRIYRCHKMEKLFPIASLPNLEVMCLNYCKKLKEIVPTTAPDDVKEVEDKKGEADRHAVKIGTLPKLTRLDLWGLPKLQSTPFVADSLQEIELMACPKLEWLPMLDRPCPPPLQQRKVWIDDTVWNSLEWDHPNAKEFVQSLKGSRP